MADVHVVPATAERWPELGRAFGARSQNPDSCWCQRFVRTRAPDNRRALRKEIEEATVPIGLIACLGEEVVGWTRVVRRSALPGITGNRALARVLDDDPEAWWVSCFVVRREARGTGIGTSLLKSAVQWASDQGASVLEGHPVDTDGAVRRSSPTAIFTGTLEMFRRAGFVEIGRTYRTRPVMRHQLGKRRPVIATC